MNGHCDENFGFVFYEKKTSVDFRMEVIAHRGMSNSFPENTVVAICEAVENGEQRSWKSMCSSRQMARWL